MTGGLHPLCVLTIDHSIEHSTLFYFRNSSQKLRVCLFILQLPRFLPHSRSTSRNRQNSSFDQPLQQELVTCNHVKNLLFINVHLDIYSNSLAVYLLSLFNTCFHKIYSLLIGKLSLYCHFSHQTEILLFSLISPHCTHQCLRKTVSINFQ